MEAGELKKRFPGADLVITGEGKIDDQSSEGKVVGYIAALAKKYIIMYCILWQQIR